MIENFNQTDYVLHGLTINITITSYKPFLSQNTKEGKRVGMGELKNI